MIIIIVPKPPSQTSHLGIKRPLKHSQSETYKNCRTWPVPSVPVPPCSAMFRLGISCTICSNSLCASALGRDSFVKIWQWFWQPMGLIGPHRASWVEHEHTVRDQHPPGYGSLVETLEWYEEKGHGHNIYIYMNGHDMVPSYHTSILYIYMHMYIWKVIGTILKIWVWARSLLTTGCPFPMDNSPTLLEQSFPWCPPLLVPSAQNGCFRP